MEQRLIDADALKRYIDDAEFCIKCQKKKLCCDIDCPMPAGLTKELERAIDEQPTVYAVPVVRCVDCVYWDRGTIHMIADNPELIGAICDKYHENGFSEDVWTAAYHFCADGERRSK